jgi:hypothetical protein
MPVKEPRVSMQVHCPACGGTGLIPAQPMPGGQVMERECGQCRGGLIPADIPLSEFKRALEETP